MMSASAISPDAPPAATPQWLREVKQYAIPCAIAVVVHAGIFVALMLFKFVIDDGKVDAVLETIFAEVRDQEEFTKDLEVETEVATTMNVVAGGAVSTAIGAASGPTVQKVNIETSTALKDPTVQVNVAEVSLPGDAMLGEDLGETEVTGEVGAVVEGYGAALGRLTQELVRLMRQEKVMVVWLFDESESMKDDQEEIRQKFHKVYEELGLAQQQDEHLRKGQEVLLTVIASYGETIHEWTAKPTHDVKEIQAAIAQVPIDESGKENMSQSVREVIRKYRPLVLRQKRKLAIVVVSDESGDDGQYIEEAVIEAKRLQSPVYVLGRESVFGYLYARQRWTDPKTGLPHWLRIRRGPETAFPENLQWDGIHERWDVYNAGFGPYEQVRLARESGGIFFVLPGEEQDLSGRGANERRKFDFLAMKEYQPLLMPRRQYAEERATDTFRKTIWDVILTLNPRKDELLLPTYDAKLNMRRHHYSVTPLEFQQQAASEVEKAVVAMSLLNQGIPLLENIKPLRAKEASQRWRAAYDLSYAQLVCFRMRLFQYLLAMDKHANDAPKPKQETSNEWNVHETREVIIPDDQQFERLKKAFGIKQTKEEYLAMVDEERKRAVGLFEVVIKDHPATPWARTANYEIQHGFGMKFSENFWDPRYNNPGLKLPNL